VTTFRRIAIAALAAATVALGSLAATRPAEAAKAEDPKVCVYVLYRWICW
jgi:hypothetical protein